jgi:hypothetical protein
MKQYTVFSSDILGRDLVVMDESGNKIENITDLALFADASLGEPIRIQLTILGVGLNVKAVGDSVTFLCPNCDQYQSHDCHA